MKNKTNGEEIEQANANLAQEKDDFVIKLEQKRDKKTKNLKTPRQKKLCQSHCTTTTTTIKLHTSETTASKHTQFPILSFLKRFQQPLQRQKQ